MIIIGDFITGIKDKYAVQLLKGRIETEGNVVSCFFKDMLLLDETNFTKDDFITKDGRYYFTLCKKIREKGFNSLDEITILSNCNETVLQQFEALGGWETIQHQIDIINLDNFGNYADRLYRENILLRLNDDGFNLLKDVKINGKDVTPLKLFRQMDAESVLDWYEARMTTYGTGYSSKIIEEEEIDFDDDFFESCAEGLENGVPFDMAGYDTNGDEINCFPFLSNQILGFLDGTFSMIGGFSSCGKSSYLVTIIMALLYRGRKVLIISNEESVKKFKIKFIVWLLGKRNRYFKLSKKKMTAGNINEEDKKQLKDIQEYWRNNYKGRVKFIAIDDADIGTASKKIRENVLRFGYDTVLYDTFKMQEADMTGTRQDLALIRDSRTLHKLAKKYNIIMLASVQLSESTRGQLFLSSANTSNSKQLKEILENYFLMRNMYPEEFDPKSKYYCHPFRLKKVNDKWIEEEYPIDVNNVYRCLFVEKARNGTNSQDNGKAYILQYDGDHSIFREIAQCYPKHGEIK